MNHKAPTMQLYEIVARRFTTAIDKADLCVKKRPECCLAGAMLLGVLLGWWIKRK
jgi:hypothetical protein